LHGVLFITLSLGQIGAWPTLGMGEQAGGERFRATGVHMGTEFTLVFYASDEGHANRAREAAFARIAALDRALSDYDPESELSRLSAGSPHAEPVGVSDDLWTVLRAAVHWSEKSQGAFDVTVGPYTRLWRQSRALHRLPAPERLAAARDAVGYPFIRLVPGQQKVQLLRSRMRLDLGGIAKGYAADQALATLRENGVRQALVDAGGDIAVGDPPPGQEGWTVALAGLDPSGAPDRQLLIRQAAIATSGDAWRYVEIGGQRYSHIIDPGTGLGVTRPTSVSVIAPTCMDADALASALSVLPPEQGLALVDSVPDVAARIVLLPAGQPAARTFLSRRFEQRTTSAKP
jgi:thiamine biosynthesis lipoprotein